MSDEEEFVADSDDSDTGVAWRARAKLRGNRRILSDDSDDDVETYNQHRHQNIIEDSDEEESHESAEEPFDDSNEPLDDRLTPTINRMIRKSILNISQHEDMAAYNSSGDEEDEVDKEVESRDNSHVAQITDDEDDKSDGVEPSRANHTPQKLDIQSPPLPTSIKRLSKNANVHSVKSPNTSYYTPTPGTSDSDTDYEEVIEVNDSHETNSSNHSDVIAVDSDSVGDRSIQTLDDSTKEEEHPAEVISAAQQEVKGPSLDPVVAQQRALIACKIVKIENELRKTKMFLREGNLGALPDKGEKLRTNVGKHEAELTRLREELSTLPLVSENSNGEYVKIRPNFDDSDPRLMLKPRENVKIEDFGKKALATFEREQALTVDRLEDLHGSLHSRPDDNERAKDPRGLKVPLMAHQQHALAWMLWREKQRPPGGVLGDDMGLGKTLTMISLVMAALAKNDDHDDDDREQWQSKNRNAKHHGGTLVVCPASLMAQWEGEVKNRVKRGLLTVELYHGNNRERVPKRLARNDMVITTYNLLSREFNEQGTLYHIDWDRVILDEAHVIRNHKSKTCEAVCALNARTRWALTGTPIHNKEVDLYATLKFLKCSPFDDLRVWKRWVDNKNAAGLERLSTLMKTLMLRRTKKELMMKGELDSLPEKNSEIINITLDHDERLVYDKVMLYSRTIFAQFLAQRAEKQHMFELGAGKYSGYIEQSVYKNTQFNKAQKKLLAQHAEVKSHEILVLLLRLRQICCHPSLIKKMLDQDDIEDDALDDGGVNGNLMNQMSKMNMNESNGNEDEGDDEMGVDEAITGHILTSENPVFEEDRMSSKYRTILKMVEEIINKNEKMIIVSQWTNNLEILGRMLKQIDGAAFKEFSGRVAVKNRQDIIDTFNDPRGNLNILLLSLTAGGVGLNLVGANHLMLIDNHWNPQLESQAQDRIYRFGQKKNVFVYKFICTDTIEERIHALQEKKLDIADAVLTGSTKKGSKLSMNDLKSLFNM